MKDNSSVNSLTCEDQETTELLKRKKKLLDKAWDRGIVTLGVFDALAALRINRKLAKKRNKLETSSLN
jgi:hypothetical protein